MKKVILPLTLIASLTAPMHSAFSQNLSPRESKPSNIPGHLAKFLLSAVDSVEMETAVSEMERNGETESIVVAKFGLNGALLGIRQVEGFDHVQKVGDAKLIPYKINISSDGSYEFRVAAFRAKNLERADFSEFWGWISLEDLTALEYTKSVDKTRGLENRDLTFGNIKLRVGIFQSSDLNHSFFLTLGATFKGEASYQIMDKDGYLYDMNRGTSNSYSTGLKYQYLNGPSTFDIEAGYRHDIIKGESSTQADIDNFNFATDSYNTALEQHYIDEQVYEEGLEEYRVSHGLDYLSESTYGQNTGIYRPHFYDNEPEMGVSDISQRINSLYGKATYSKYFRDQNIKLTVTADGQYNIKNEISGSNDLNSEGIDTYRAGLNFRVDY